MHSWMSTPGLYVCVIEYAEAPLNIELPASTYGLRAIWEEIKVAELVYTLG